MSAGSPAPATAAPEPVLRRWRNAVFVIFWLTGFIFASWATRVPNVRDILDASTGQMGLLILGLAAGSVLGLFASSHVIARLGATASILVCLSLASVGLVLVGVIATFAPGLVILFVALMTLGVGYSITDVAMNLSGAANERRIGRTLMPMFHASFSLGTMLGAGFGALTEHFGVPIGAHLVGVGLAALLTTRIAVRFLQPAEHVVDDELDDSTSGPAAFDSMADPLIDAPSPDGWRSRMSVWRDPRILLIGLIVLGMAFAEGSANDWLSLSMVDGYGTTNAGGAVVFGVFVTAMTVGRVLGGRVLDRFGRIAVLRGTAALAVVGLLLVILGPNLGAAVVGVVLWGLGASLGFPVGMSAAADDPRTATASVAAVATIGYFAFLIGPPLIGLLGERVGLLNAFWVVVVLTVVAGLCATAAREPSSPER
ncbi:MAG TPA: MFS transporter [Microlunatus sp.]|nr:MFS transporter [Microlunatus sp.]